MKSNTGQGPYTVEWPTNGDKTVSLYVEESGFVSDTTTHNIYIVYLTSDFQLQDTACIAHTIEIIYTGNASPSAMYYWDFDSATIISGSGQGPYTVQWSSIGNKTVSLYVEESGYVTDTTANNIYIEYLTSEFQLQDIACIFNPVEIIYIGSASDSATYYWDFDNANIISGSGQGPYTVQWTSLGDKTVSLYVEESSYVSDTTINEIYVKDKPVFLFCAMGHPLHKTGVEAFFVGPPGRALRALSTVSCEFSIFNLIEKICEKVGTF